MNRPLRVFLCHSSNDKPAVRELYQKLRAEPWIQPWLDEEELFPGMDWNMEIEKAVEAADAIIVCLTKNSINKEGYVQRELRIVLDFADYKPEGTLYIIPVRLEECEPPRRLRAWQYADYFEGQRERGFQRLLVSMKRRAESLGLKTETPAPKQADKPVVGRVSNLTETVAPKQSQAESQTYETDHSKNTEESNEYASLIESVSISSEEVKKQYEQFDALAVKQGVMRKKIDKAPNKLTLSNGMEFMRVPAGKFLMGSKDNNKLAGDDEKPQHSVDIPYDYWVARYPVTNHQYNIYVKAKRINHPGVDWEEKKDHPVVYVSWNDAMAYCQWLNTLLKAELSVGLVLRLPAEDEWEKSARDIDGSEYPWGNLFDKKKCNSREGGKGDTTPVGLYSPHGDSPYGCADMAGNVWEFTYSLMRDYHNKNKTGDPNRRVIRGGSFQFDRDFARSAFRDTSGITASEEDFGFRIVLAPKHIEK
jgi:formylglycine-generating enzyme required for sulfatase activity